MLKHLSLSPSRRSRAADAILIDEDVTSDVIDSSSKPVTLKTSSPVPVGIITSEPPCLSLDPSKRLPMHQFGSSLEVIPRCPMCGQGAGHLRRLEQIEAEAPRPYRNIQLAKAPVISRIASSAQADGSPEMCKVRQIEVYF